MDVFLFNTHNKNIWVFKSKSHLVKIKSIQLKKKCNKIYHTCLFKAEVLWYSVFFLSVAAHISLLMSHCSVLRKIPAQGCIGRELFSSQVFCFLLL